MRFSVAIFLFISLTTTLLAQSIPLNIVSSRYKSNEVLSLFTDLKSGSGEAHPIKIEEFTLTPYKIEYSES